MTLAPSDTPEAGLSADTAHPLLTGWQARARRDATAMGRTILALMLREMSTRYGRSPGGYLWSVLEPVGGILVLALGFALIARTPPLGTSFLLYFATGMMPFSLYNDIEGAVSRSLTYSRALLMYPAVRWIDAVLARFFLNLLTKMVIMFIILAGTVALTETRSMLDFGSLIAGLGMAALLGLAVGLVNCVLEGLFPVWGMVWGIATRPLFLASGVFLLYEQLSPTAQAVLWWNPLLHVIGEFRSGFYPMYTAAYVSPAYVMGITLSLIALGLMLVRRHHVTILEN